MMYKASFYLVPLMMVGVSVQAMIKPGEESSFGLPIRVTIENESSKECSYAIFGKKNEVILPGEHIHYHKMIDPKKDNELRLSIKSNTLSKNGSGRSTNYMTGNRCNTFKHLISDNPTVGGHYSMRANDRFFDKYVVGIRFAFNGADKLDVYAIFNFLVETATGSTMDLDKRYFYTCVFNQEKRLGLIKIVLGVSPSFFFDIAAKDDCLFSLDKITSKDLDEFKKELLKKKEVTSFANLLGPVCGYYKYSSRDASHVSPIPYVVYDSIEKKYVNNMALFETLIANVRCMNPVAKTDESAQEKISATWLQYGLLKVCTLLIALGSENYLSEAEEKTDEENYNFV